MNYCINEMFAKFTMTKVSIFLFFFIFYFWKTAKNILYSGFNNFSTNKNTLILIISIHIVHVNVGVNILLILKKNEFIIYWVLT